MDFRAGLVVLAALLGMSASAQALPITGAFQLTATATPVNAGVTADMASGLNFTGNMVTSFSATGGGTVIGGLAGCSSNCGTINNIASFASFSTIAPLFSLTNGLSFDLTSYASPTRTAASGMSLAKIALSGTGTYHLTGYDDTFGTFGIVTTGSTSYVTVAFGEASGSNAVIPPIYVGGATTPASPTPPSPVTTQGTPIPEPGAAAIMCGALVVLVLLGRRRTET